MIKILMLAAMLWMVAFAAEAANLAHGLLTSDLARLFGA